MYIIRKDPSIISKITVMSTEDIKSSFPSKCKLAFGSSEKKQHTNLIKRTEDLEIHGMFATIFRTTDKGCTW